MGVILVAKCPNESTQRFSLETEANIGRVTGNDLQLPYGNVSKHHARMLFRDGRVIITDLKSTNGTFVNGRRITKATIMRVGDTIAIGNWRITIEDEDGLADFVATDPREKSFLDEIQNRPHDDEVRQVYSDWLEEQGRTAEAELISIEREIRTLREDDRRLTPLGDRLRTLASSLPAGWRMLVARPPIEGCHNKSVRFELTCPKRWDGLEATDDPRVRSCHACEERVYFAPTIEQARVHAREGRCVAVDIAIPRTPNDLDEPVERIVTMGRMVRATPIPPPMPSSDEPPPPQKNR